MSSYKLCLTLLVLVSISVTANSIYDSSYHRRARRSSDGREQAVESTTEDSEDHGFQAGYRFGEEFFLPEASKSIPAEYKKKADGCERVVKDSMVCMVCKDPKTNAKYEQCSYVGNPLPKAPPVRQHTETKEVSHAPESSSESSESSAPPRSSYGNYESSAPPRDSSSYDASAPEATRYNYKDYAPVPYSYSDNSRESGSSEDPAESANCRQIEKDSQTCRVCKDPITGKDFERCSSRYQPDDKTYGYDNTEKYGYPDSREDDKADDKSYENKSESSDCRQVKKDDQICAICRDPNTGGDTERCSSSYHPADKSYAYGTSERYGAVPPHGEKDYKPYNDDDKSADATYDSPSEYQSGYPTSNDDRYKKYRNDLPEEYRQSSYDGGSEYRGSSPNYDRSSGAEYAAPSIPAASRKASENGRANGCHEVQKDSMTCTVCTDPKTGGNLEKCSYAYQPNDKVYKFTKSKSFGYPETGAGTKDRVARGRKSGKGSTDSVRQSESKQVVDAVKVSPCKQIQKDSMICTVCKDSKSGGSSEQCTYGSKPSEKLFTYATSKSFGNPRKEGERRGNESGEEEQQESQQTPQWSGEATRQFVAESKQVADAVQTSPCREVEKDSMTCTVCKDPKTGARSEQCTYSSKPKENHYTYSKSKSSGRPRKEREGRGEGTEDERQEPRETKQVVDIVEVTSPCRKIEKDSMTCTVCKDPKTGENSEQCAYSYKPKERHFSYAKSFGNPAKERERGGKGSLEEKPQEIHQISRWSNDRQDDFAMINRPRGFTKPNWSYSE